MPGFVRRERKHKKIARVQKAGNDDPNSSSNIEALPTETSIERDARRHALREQLVRPETKVSSKKRKRLDKYIETKLRKDEAADLVRKLEKQKVDTSSLQSSKTLGKVYASQKDKRSRHEQELPTGNDEIDLQAREIFDETDSDVESHESESDNGDATLPLTVQPSERPATEFGSGLKRPLGTDDSGRPLIKKRKRRKVEKPCEVHSAAEEEVDDEEDEWEGFSADEHASNAALWSDDESEGSSASSGSDSPAPEDEEDSKPRVSAFKAWADNLRNTALDFTPSSTSATAVSDDKIKQNFRPRQPSPDPVLTQAIVDGAASAAPSAGISVPRSDEIQASRLELPVVQEEQKIVESIQHNPVVVICGATGSGKTTQIPQILFENGYGSRIGDSNSSHVNCGMSPQSKGMIGVTQPRRVAATSVAARVQYELGTGHGKRVAHQVRYDTNVQNDTAIKFMTDGILLREIQNDYSLSKYSVIVLDEAHERSVNTDILIGMLARIVPLRAQISQEHPYKYYSLKLVIMSATLSQGVNSFLQNEKLWGPCGGLPPVISVEGRQFPVTVHFARKTRRDYVNEIVEKVARGHRKLPPGGMLVFLTGQEEIRSVMTKLSGKIDRGGSRYGGYDDYDEDDGLGRNEVQRDQFLEDEMSNQDADSDAEIETNNEAEFSIPTQSEHQHKATGTLKPHILPLYAALPHDQQQRVFKPAPAGARQIILSTNVAETSLTIPGIRYVFDCGRAKVKHYSTSTGVQTFEVGLISKASAEQRKGRAGRTGPGHVWRLYSSNVYEEMFAEETVPEILRTGLESVVLQLKSMDIKNVETFPYPTAPEPAALKKAEDLLRHLGATSTGKSAITQAGRSIMKFPVHPRYGIMLLLAQSNGLVEYAIALVAALATGELFVPEIHGQSPSQGAQDEDSDDSSISGREHRKAEENAAKAMDASRHRDYMKAQATLAKWDDESDAIKMLIAVLAHADPECNNGNLSTFCRYYFLREKGMAEAQLLRRQLHSIVHGDSTKFQEKLSLPKEKEFPLLKQLVAAGFIDQVAIRADLLPNYTSGFVRKPRKPAEVPYRTLLPSLNATETPAHFDKLEASEKEIIRSVFMHPNSVMARVSVSEMPEYITYSHLSRAAANSVGDTKVKKTRFHPLTPVSAKALGALAEGTPLLQLGKPIGKIEELPSIAGEGGRVQRRQCWISVGLKAPGSQEREWPLPPWKVIQRRSGKEWEIEKVLGR